MCVFTFEMTRGPLGSTLEGSQLVDICELERKRETHHVTFCITILSFPIAISHIPLITGTLLKLT